jgi:hypothetical protein
MRQPSLPTDPISPLFSEDTEPDGSPAYAPTMTFYGSRQIFPPQRGLSVGTELPPDKAQPAPPQPAQPNGVPQFTAPWSNLRSGPPRPQAAATTSEAILDRFPITAAWLSGALVGVIAHSLARGDVWKIGPLQEATGPHVIWLRPGTSHEFQVAVWLVIPTTPVLGS